MINVAYKFFDIRFIYYNMELFIIKILFANILYEKLRPLSLSELTPYQISLRLTHLGSKVSKR